MVDTSDVDELIDEFVARINRRGLPPELCEDVPSRLNPVSISPGEPGICTWQITRANTSGLAAQVEHRIGRALPLPYASLINRYVFLPFEIADLELLGNAGTQYHDVSRTPFETSHLFHFLLEKGYVRFAVPAGGADQDYICFDLNRMSPTHDCPVVKIDHEDYHLRSRLRVISQLVPCFLELVRKVVSQPTAN